MQVWKYKHLITTANLLNKDVVCWKYTLPIATANLSRAEMVSNQRMRDDNVRQPSDLINGGVLLEHVLHCDAEKFVRLFCVGEDGNDRS